MQANIAIGLVENSSIALGIEATDVMCKMAQVELLKGQVIARGKYIILISGRVAFSMPRAARLSATAARATTSSE